MDNEVDNMTQANLSEILHNVADHTETFFRFLGETNIADDLRNRLIDHIILEESENTDKLQQLHDGNPTAITQKLLDHSYILQRIMRDGTMPLDLKQELLHHFMEEHTEWQQQLGVGHDEPGSGGVRVEAGDRGDRFGAGPRSQVTGGTHDTAHGAHQRGGGHGGDNRHKAQFPESRDSGQGGDAHGTGYGAERGRAHQGSRPGNKPQDGSVGASQSKETNGWTVGPMWNQGG